MPGVLWSRSRYWLCHFLHNRHVRVRTTSLICQNQTASDRVIQQWLDRFADRANHTSPWLVDAALATHPNDPAFVQCLRLWIKEDQALAKLARHLLQQGSTDTQASAQVFGLIPSLPQMRRKLGLRFEVSILLLGNVLEVASLKHLRVKADAPALRRGIEQLLHDRQQHIAFASEWLTREFADFNFLRRNLRRLRLRVLFALMLADYLLHHGSTLQQLGLSRWFILRQTWRSFAQLLENMVPYHRDALLAQLLAQRQHPYDQPARML